MYSVLEADQKAAMCTALIMQLDGLKNLKHLSSKKFHQRSGNPSGRAGLHQFIVGEVSQTPAAALCTNPNHDETIPRPGMAYARYFKPWSWTIYTGVFVEYIDNDFYKSLGRLGIFLASWSSAASRAAQVVNQPMHPTSRQAI